MKKLLRVLAVILFIVFIILNVISAFNAYYLTHFFKEGEIEEVGFSKLGLGGKIKYIVFGQKFVKSHLVPGPALPHKDVALTTQDGKRLAAWHFIHPATDSVKGTVCAFHGQKASRGGLADEIAVFYNDGWNVFTIDFRGHAESEGYVTTFGMEEVYDVKAAYDYVQSTGENNIAFYGQSMGAATEIRATGKLGLKPSKIISDAGFGSMVDAVEGRCRMMHIPPEPFGVLVTFWLGVEEGYWGFDNANWKYGENINCPVLIQRGTHDQRVSEQESQKVLESLSSDIKMIVRYEGLGHENYYNKQPEKWSQTVLQFLNSNTVPAASLETKANAKFK